MPSGRGTAWWSEGWRLFTAAPGVWIAITVIFVVLMVMITFIPFLGTLATTLLTPVFAGGVMVGCRALDRGGQLTIGHLFASFSDRLSPLIIVGVLYLVGTCIIAILVFGVLLGSVGMAGMGMLLGGDPLEAGFGMLAGLGVGALIALLIATLVGIPLMMAYWYAPALVVFRNDEPIAAMKASFHACLVNVWPMFVYSLVGLVFAIVASIPLGLGWLVLAPVFAASVYASYKDIFGLPD
ncbi:MAG: BPSS1780 family membrane protein [Betaproteobacteria bacterium]